MHSKEEIDLFKYIEIIYIFINHIINEVNHYYIMYIVLHSM